MLMASREAYDGGRGKPIEGTWAVISERKGERIDDEKRTDQGESFDCER